MELCVVRIQEKQAGRNEKTGGIKGEENVV
jgi:hypothetical protein